MQKQNRRKNQTQKESERYWNNSTEKSSVSVHVFELRKNPKNKTKSESMQKRKNEWKRKIRDGARAVKRGESWETRKNVLLFNFDSVTKAKEKPIFRLQSQSE